MVSFGIFRTIKLGPRQPHADFKSVQIKMEGIHGGYPAVQVTTKRGINPGQSLLLPSISTVQPGQSLLRPGQSLLQARQPPVKPSQSLLPSNLTVKPGQSLLKSQQSSTNQCKTASGEEPTLFGPTYQRNTTNNNKRNRSCKKCGVVFSNWIKYKNHKAEVHGIAITYSCQICSQVFASRESLGQHKSAEHGQTSSFYCPICSRTFLSTQACKDHIASHQNIKPYECLICNAKFTYIHSYRRHSRTCRQR